MEVMLTDGTGLGHFRQVVRAAMTEVPRDAPVTSSDNLAQPVETMIADPACWKTAKT